MEDTKDTVASATTVDAANPSDVKTKEDTKQKSELKVAVTKTVKTVVETKETVEELIDDAVEAFFKQYPLVAFVFRVGKDLFLSEHELAAQQSSKAFSAPLEVITNPFNPATDVTE